MKLSKKKVFALALAVCLIATLSFGSLAWFTDNDSVTNEFKVAGSETGKPDDVFSVDVWEDKNGDGQPDDDIDGDGEGLIYEAILPGDNLHKDANIENTGAYEQYVRAIVTVSDAHIWQDLHMETYVSLDKIATDLNSDFQTWSIAYNEGTDTLTYVLYYKNKLDVDKVVNLFTNIHIPEAMDREQGAEMAGGFNINVVAEAVQTENVCLDGDATNDVSEAFETVGMGLPAGESAVLTSSLGAYKALKDGLLDVVTIDEEAENSVMEINFPVADVTIDANGTNTTFKFTDRAENVVITNIQDTADTDRNSVDVSGAAAGSKVTVMNSTFICSGGNYGAGIRPGQNCDLTIDTCKFIGSGTYGAYHNGAAGAFTVINSTFENIGKWAILINGDVNGDVVISGCTFTNCSDGIFKCSVAGGISVGQQNGEFVFTNNTLNNCVGHDGAESKLIVVKYTDDAIEVSGNTRDGADFVPGEAQGIVKKS